MLQFHVTGHMSSLTLSEKRKNGLPVYVTTKDMKLGLSNFWKSPYLNGTSVGNNKRELPIVVPPRLCSRQSVRSNRSANRRNVKGILKSAPDSNSDGSLVRKRLRRASSFNTRSTGEQSTKKVQFGELEEQKLDVQSVLQDVNCESNGVDSETRNTELEYPRSSGCADDLTMGPTRSAKLDIDNRPSTALGLVSDEQFKDVSKPTTQSALTAAPTINPQKTQRILRRENTVKQKPSATVIRPKTCIGGQRAISNHKNFCDKDTTIRILKWLKDVDDVQIKEGKCTELCSDLASSDYST